MPVISKPEYCRPCVGWSWSEHGPGQGFSSLEGYGQSGLFAVAEALGEQEEEDGLPLRPHGASGRIFSRTLDELGINRQSLTITNVVRCFVGGTQVYLPDGTRRRIGDLVNSGYRGDVLSYDAATKKFVARKVLEGHANSDTRRLLKVTYTGAKNTGRGQAGVVCTEDHEFLTEDGKWVQAKDLQGHRINIGPHGLGDRAFQVAIGTLLGDAGMHRDAAVLFWGHCVEQQQWSETKAAVLGATVSGPHDRMDGKGGMYVRAHVKASRQMADLKHEFYSPHKRVPLWIRTALKPQGLATWFLDDGHLLVRKGKRRPLAEIATCAFSPEDLQVLVDALWVNGLEAKAKNGRIYFDVKNTEALVQLISPYVPPSMRYKLGSSEWLYPFNPDFWSYDPPVAFYAPAKVVEYKGVLSREQRKVFCLTVEGTNNFVTPVGVVHNCRPPGNELWGKPYTFPAISHCRRYLAGAIDQRKPTFLLALGDTPYQELVADYCGSLSEVRGFVLPSVYGVPLIATYHPAYITRGAWNLYGAFKQDVGKAAIFARDGVPAMLETDYALHPELSDVRAFLADVLAHPEWPISYDVETAHMLGEKEPDDWRLKRLVQVQFSIRPGHAIVCPWDGGEFTALIRAILATPNPKWGWNSRLSDDIVLRANGCTLGGELHDLMLAWAHLQPDFTAKGDDRDGDEKGIPSRLMGLQSAASFYCPEVGPWKHLGGSNLQLYGAFDADYTTRCGIGIFGELGSYGLGDGYREHKYELKSALDVLGEHGLPVDRDKQAALRVYTLGELYRIQNEIHAQVPSETLSVHPKTGYKALHTKVGLGTADDPPKVVLRDLVADYDPSVPLLVQAAGHIGYLKQREFKEDGNGKKRRGVDNRAGEAQHELSHQLVVPVEAVHSDGSVAGLEDNQQIAESGVGGDAGKVLRWCIERIYNPHASSPNTKAYIRAMGYPMPTNYNTGADTTGLTELDKLAKETGDPVLRLTYDWRKLRKTGLDYTTGKWVPGGDGRVHPTFRTGTTASQQTTCTDPNAQQYPEHSELAKRAKEAVRAEPGHIFVKIDMRGFHSRAVGWLAGDPVYYDLADSDVHSFISAHYLHLPDAPYLLEMSDDERRGALAAVKREHSHTRNYKVKRVVHGRQFNMGLRKLYQLHGADFDPPAEVVRAEVGDARWYSWNPSKQLDEIHRRGWAEAKKLYQLFDQLFPRTFVLYIEWVREQIYHVTPNRLVSPFGHHRFFWGYDMEQAAAFLPSNCAHCHIQSAMIRMYRTGDLWRFGACNFTHDALWLHPTIADVDECVATVQREFEAPSTVLTDSPLGPFQCNSDAEVGYDLAHMVGYDDWVGKGRPTADQWAMAFPPKG